MRSLYVQKLTFRGWGVVSDGYRIKVTRTRWGAIRKAKRINRRWHRVNKHAGVRYYIMAGGTVAKVGNKVKP